MLTFQQTESKESKWDMPEEITKLMETVEKEGQAAVVSTGYVQRRLHPSIADLLSDKLLSLQAKAQTTRPLRRRKTGTTSQ